METTEILTNHWAMDEQAATVLSERAHSQGGNELLQQIHEQLDKEAVAIRDEHRRDISTIFRGESDQKLIVIGPCSLDMDIDYEPLFGFIEVLQEQFANTLIAFRGNGSKPRTTNGWTGLWNGVDSAHRRRVREIHNEAFLRGIPIFTEITEGSQLTSLAPRLSAVWIGARDIESSALRSKFSAIQLPVGLKNGITGDMEIVKNAIIAIRSNTTDNDGCGVDLGVFGSTNDSLGFVTGVLPVSKGNEATAIFARGHKLPEKMTTEDRKRAAFGHLSSATALSRLMQSTVLIDGTHDVPPMLNIDKKAEFRFLSVLGEISDAISKGAIENANQISGFLGEVGVNRGRTDPNLVIDTENKKALERMVSIILNMLQIEGSKT